MKSFVVFAIVLLVANISHATKMDTTEVSIGDFSEFISATGLVTFLRKKVFMVYEGDQMILQKAIGISVNLSWCEGR